MVILKRYREIKEKLDSAGARLVAVTKTRSVDEMLELYRLGQRELGENRVQELVSKKDQLPQDVQWHMIGHLQRNKVKYIAPFVHLIHAVDSLELLREIDKQAKKHQRIISCLLQLYIAKEESKYGLSEDEILELVQMPEFQQLKNIEINGLMGMATNTDDNVVIRREFRSLSTFFNQLKNTVFSGEKGFTVLSMGMSSDYEIALEEGSNLVRIGSRLFEG